MIARHIVISRCERRSDHPAGAFLLAHDSEHVKFLCITCIFRIDPVMHQVHISLISHEEASADLATHRGNEHDERA